MPKASKKKTTPKKKQQAASVKEKRSKSPKAFLNSRAKSRRERKQHTRDNHNNITGSFRLFADSVSLFRQHWKIFGGITLVYVVLSVILIGVRGSGLEVDKLRGELDDSFEGGLGEVGLGLTIFSLVASSSTSSSSEGGAYQSIVLLIISLATVWALRQIMAGQKIGIRDAFYKGMYPLVPVVLVIMVIGLQLIPLLIGSFLFAVAFPGGIAVGFVEQALWAIVIFLLALLSLYMLTSSTFAFYVATLPDMRPLAALRSARKLVRFRRFTVLRKLLFLPLALLIVIAALTLPFIWIWPAATQWVFLLLSMAGLVFTHTYAYSLYKELL